MSHASKVREAVGRHYGTGELAHRIRQALQNAHGDTHPLNTAELAPIDQFHVGGIAATKEMAEGLRLRAGATALDLKFEDNSFDFAWTQHVAMNIRERAQLYAGVHRVLKPGGRFAMYDVTAVDKSALVFPVPWARTPQVSFLLT